MTEKLIIDLSNASGVADLGEKISSALESGNALNNVLYLKLGNIDLKQSQLLSIKALIEAMQSKIIGIETSSEITETSAVGLSIPVGKAEQTTYEFDKSYEPQVSKSFEEEIISDGEINSFAQLKKLNSVGDSVTDTQNLSEVETENLQQETENFIKEAQNEDTPEMTKEERVANIEDSLDKEMTHEDISDALDITFGEQKVADTTTESPAEISSEDAGYKAPETEESEDIFAHIKLEEKYQDKEITETVESAEESKYILLDTEGITPEGIELIKSNTSDLDTLYLTQTLRSGQTVSYEGNIFLIGDAHPGSEINATGDVTVWGILGGIVHAGTKGNTDAKVRALKLNPIQLRIANLYSRRNDTINVPYVQKSNEFTPEEARIENEQIVIYKTLRRED